MPKRSSKPPADVNEAALAILRSATGESPPTEKLTLAPKNPAAVALGSLGGKKGGLARAKALTAEQRIQTAKKAAAARWKKPAE